mmetsp:Transcript_137/g.424  ORF Transcript_137/g.424 Transcript_137/m.424 type:complete len:201 (+) Transcript_137:751-1353(+)
MCLLPPSSVYPPASCAWWGRSGADAAPPPSASPAYRTYCCGPTWIPPLTVNVRGASPSVEQGSRDSQADNTAGAARYSAACFRRGSVKLASISTSRATAMCRDVPQKACAGAVPGEKHCWAAGQQQFAPCCAAQLARTAVGETSHSVLPRQMVSIPPCRVYGHSTGANAMPAGTLNPSLVSWPQISSPKQFGKDLVHRKR